MRLTLAFIAVWGTLQRLGGVGLGVLALLDGFLVPLPGSVDVLLVILAARYPDWWLMYAAIATVGSVAGGYLTYRLARKGGEEALKKRLPKGKAEKVRRTFDRWGFGSIFVPALLPPPVPASPFFVTAGACLYPRKKFVAALASSRAIRFAIVGYLGSQHGGWILRMFSTYYMPLLYLLLAMAVMGACFAIWHVVRRRRAGRPVIGEKAA